MPFILSCKVLSYSFSLHSFTNLSVIYYLLNSILIILFIIYPDLPTTFLPCRAFPCNPLYLCSFFHKSDCSTYYLSPLQFPCSSPVVSMMEMNSRDVCSFSVYMCVTLPNTASICLLTQLLFLRTLLYYYLILSRLGQDTNNAISYRKTKETFSRELQEK